MIKYPALQIHRDVVPFELFFRFFLTYGADPNACGPYRFNIIDVAAASSTTEVFSPLVQHGASIRRSDVLHVAAGAAKNTPERPEMMAFLLDTVKMDISTIAKHGPPAGRGIWRGMPLHSATVMQAKDRIEFLLERGAGADARNTLGQAALNFAGEWDLDDSAEIYKAHKY